MVKDGNNTYEQGIVATGKEANGMETMSTQDTKVPAEVNVMCAVLGGSWTARQSVRRTTPIWACRWKTEWAR